MLIIIPTDIESGNSNYFHYTRPERLVGNQRSAPRVVVARGDQLTSGGHVWKSARKQPRDVGDISRVPSSVERGPVRSFGTIHHPSTPREYKCFSDLNEESYMNYKIHELD